MSSYATLQVSTKGMWVSVVTFATARLPDVLKAVRILADALPDAKWSFLLPDGTRDYIKPLANLEKDSMRTLNRALTIADRAARSNIERYAAGSTDGIYDLTRPASTGAGETEETMALQVQIAQLGAAHIRSRDPEAFPFRMLEVDGNPNLVCFENKAGP